MFDIGASPSVHFLKFKTLLPGPSHLDHQLDSTVSLGTVAVLPLQLRCPHTECPRTGRLLESPPSRRAAALTQHLRGGRQPKSNREDRVGVLCAVKKRKVLAAEKEAFPIGRCYFRK